MWSIPILTYHKISCDKEIGLTTISPNKFKSQLEIIINQQYHFTSFKKLNSSEYRSIKPIIITFDDGYESIHRHAFPVMQKLNLTGVIFIVADYIGKKNTWESYSLQRKFDHLTRDQLVELRNAGFEIGSHSRRHLYLNNKSERVLKTETEDSKKIIEDILGEEIITFCYPFGNYNQRVLNAVREAGYKFAMGNAKFRHYSHFPNLNLSRRTIYSLDSEKIVMNKIKTYPYHGISFLSEWVIQRGALANIYRQNLMKYQ